MSLLAASDCTSDRRYRRSQRMLEALHHQLVHIADSFDLDVMTLSDADGQLIASSATSSLGQLIGEVVVAFSPMLTEERVLSSQGQEATKRLFKELRLLGLSWSVDQMLVYEFYTGTRRMYLTAVGGDEEMRELIAYRVIFGVRRILNQLEA